MTMAASEDDSVDNTFGDVELHNETNQSPSALKEPSEAADAMDDKEKKTCEVDEEEEGTSPPSLGIEQTNDDDNNEKATNANQEKDQETEERKATMDDTCEETAAGEKLVSLEENAYNPSYPTKTTTPDPNEKEEDGGDEIKGGGEVENGSAPTPSSFVPTGPHMYPIQWTASWPAGGGHPPTMSPTRAKQEETVPCKSSKQIEQSPIRPYPCPPPFFYGCGLPPPPPQYPTADAELGVPQFHSVYGHYPPNGYNMQPSGPGNGGNPYLMQQPHSPTHETGQPFPHPQYGIFYGAAPPHPTPYLPPFGGEETNDDQSSHAGSDAHIKPEGKENTHQMVGTSPVQSCSLGSSIEPSTEGDGPGPAIRNYVKAKPTTNKVILEKRQKKNQQSRARANKQKESVRVICAKPPELRSEQENMLVAAFEERRFKKNSRSKERAMEKKEALENIMAKSPEKRTRWEIEFIEDQLRKKKRKNEGDRKRRERLKQLGVTSKTQLKGNPKISARGPLPMELLEEAGPTQQRQPDAPPIVPSMPPPSQYQYPPPPQGNQAPPPGGFPVEASWDTYGVPPPPTPPRSAATPISTAINAVETEKHTEV